MYFTIANKYLLLFILLPLPILLSLMRKSTNATAENENGDTIKQNNKKPKIIIKYRGEKPATSTNEGQTIFGTHPSTSTAPGHQQGTTPAAKGQQTASIPTADVDVSILFIIQLLMFKIKCQ